MTVTPVGNQKHHQANRSSPVFDELHGLTLKIDGVAEPPREALRPLTRKIDAAFVYGSVAAGPDRAQSDIDLLVISSRPDYAAVYEALGPAERVLAWPINPAVLTRAEWRSRRAKGIAFARQGQSRGCLEPGIVGREFDPKTLP